MNGELTPRKTDLRAIKYKLNFIYVISFKIKQLMELKDTKNIKILVVEDDEIAREKVS